MDFGALKLEIKMQSRLLYAIYPFLVGILLGTLQTGLFFQLSFTLSSSFGTFLMITLCWLIGSAIGVSFSRRIPFYSGVFIVLSLLAYFLCGLLVRIAPYDTRLLPVYAALVTLTGLYPGIFFARMGAVYTAQKLFFRENNGFIFGLVSGTLLFLLFGRGVLWVLPLVLTAAILAIREPVSSDLQMTMSPDNLYLNALSGEDQSL
jgi:hypothetical protein